MPPVNPDRIGAPAGLVRQRLLDELRTLRTHRLALAVAPAGSGKTTLLAHLAGRWPGPVGWWQADPGDTTGQNVIDAVWRALPGLPPPGPGRDLDDLLAAAQAATAPDTLLIIDDAHCLGPAAEAMLEAVVHRAPHTLHVLAAARRMPALNLSRHELSGVLVIDAEQLRFRSWEAEYLLRDVYREPLPPDDAAALSRRVGGWAAGLHMFHLSTRGRPLAERRRAVAELDGRSALTRAYLARTVLAELPAPLSDFLMRTCVFTTLTAHRCELLLGNPGTSGRYLAELERRQAFTTTTDGGQTYRYHEVLRSHLAAVLAEELGDSGARAWYARASALLAGEGAHLEAARAAARAEDWPGVRRLLAGVGDDAHHEAWHDVLPVWLIAEDPWLQLAEGRRLMHRGRFTEAVACLRTAEGFFADERGRARCRAERRLAANWLPGATPAPPGHPTALLREATRRHPALVAADLAAPPLVRAVALLLSGNVAEARRALAPGPADDAGLAGFAAQLTRTAIDLAAGVPDAGPELSRLVALGERAGYAWLARIGRAVPALDATEAGLAQARAVAGECERDGDPWGAAIALALICLVRSVREPADPGCADDAADLVRRCRALDAGVLDAWAQALLALAEAAAGLPTAELEAQRADGLARSAGVPGARAAAQAAAARAGQGRLDLAVVAGEVGLPVDTLATWAGVPARVRVEVVAVPPVEVWCFGGFRMLREGRPVPWSAVKPRTRTALRLLAMYAGRPVHRETMIEALWPEMPAATATRNLHVTLSSLRTFLEPGSPRGRSSLVVRNGDAYELALPPDGFHDVAAFLAALDTARRARLGGDRDAVLDALRTAVWVYGGELLPEDGPAEWVVREREALRRRAADSAIELARTELASGDVARAVAAAERCVQIDRYCDPGWRLLADGYARLGNPAAASRAARDYALVLASLDEPDPPPSPGRRPPPRPPRTAAPAPSRRQTARSDGS